MGAGSGGNSLLKPFGYDPAPAPAPAPPPPPPKPYWAQENPYVSNNSQAMSSPFSPYQGRGQFSQTMQQPFQPMQHQQQPMQYQPQPQYQPQYQPQQQCSCHAEGGLVDVLSTMGYKSGGEG